jgi:hypothetical protein
MVDVTPFGLPEYSFWDRLASGLTQGGQTGRLSGFLGGLLSDAPKYGLQQEAQKVQAGNIGLQSALVNNAARLRVLGDEGLLPPGFTPGGLLGQVMGGAAPAAAPPPAQVADASQPGGMPEGGMPGGGMPGGGLPPMMAPLPQATPPARPPGIPGVRDALRADVIFPGAGKGIIEKQYPGPTDMARLIQERNAIAAQDPTDPRIGIYNLKIAKDSGRFENLRQGGAIADLATGTLPIQNPVLGEGVRLGPGGAAETVPNFVGAAAPVRNMEAQAKANFEPMQRIDAEGNQYTVPRSALQGGASPRSAAPGAAPGAVTAPRPAPPGVALPMPTPGAPASAPGALPPTGGPGGLPSGLGPRQQANLQGQGKGAGEDFNQVRADAAEAARTIDDIRTVRQIPAETGRLAPSQEIIGGYLDALGVNSSYVRKAANLQEFNSIAANYVLGKQLEQKGVQTEGDARRMRETFASMTNIGEANDFILRVVEAQKTRMLDKQAFYEANASDPKVAAKWSQTVRQTPLVAKGPSGPVFLNEYLETAKAQGVPMDQALAAWQKRAK